MGKLFQRTCWTMAAVISAFSIGFCAGNTLLNKKPEKLPKTGVTRVYEGKYYDEHFQKAQEGLDKLCVIWNYHLPCSIYNPEEQDAFLAYIDEQLKNDPDPDEKVKSLLPIKRRFAWDDHIRNIPIMDAKEDDSLKQRAEKAYFQFRDQFVYTNKKIGSKSSLEIEDEIEETGRFSGDCTEFVTKFVSYWRSQDHPTEKGKLKAFAVKIPNIVNLSNGLESEPHEGILAEIDRGEFVLLDFQVFDIDRDYIEIMKTVGKGLIINKSCIRISSYLEVKDDITALCSLYVDLAEQSTKNDSQKLSIYELIRRINPAYLDAYNNKGLIYLKQGDFGNARQIFEEAVAIDPNYYAAHHNIGYLCFLEEKYGAAAECFEKAVGINPRIAISQYYLGLSYEKIGKLKESQKCLGKALQLNPNLNK